MSGGNDFVFFVLSNKHKFSPPRRLENAPPSPACEFLYALGVVQYGPRRPTDIVIVSGLCCKGDSRAFWRQRYVFCFRCAGYTLALWMKIETECSRPIAIVSTESSVALVYQSGILRFRFHKSGSTWLLVAEGVVVGRWHHVTVTWSATAGLSLYIDATLAARCGVFCHICGAV